MLGLEGWDIISYLARDIISPSPFHIKGPSMVLNICIYIYVMYVYIYILYVYLNPPLNHGILGVFTIRGMGLVLQSDSLYRESAAIYEPMI